jgi:3-methyladenine DNA glycosylase AlkD
MQPDEMLSSIEQQLKALGSAQGIASAHRFFKEPVDPYGVSAKQVKKLEQGVYREVKHWPAAQRNTLCTALLRQGKLENGALVAYLYARFARQCARCEFLLFERWIDRFVHNWAHTDAICTLLIDACIVNEPSLAAAPLEWTQSHNRWKRRAAAVSLVKAARRGQHTETIFAIAEELMEDGDGMVQKGTGWLLKETYPKHPKETVDFLLKWKDRTSRLLLRYAAEKMTPSDRKRVLA